LLELRRCFERDLRNAVKDLFERAEDLELGFENCLRIEFGVNAETLVQRRFAADSLRSMVEAFEDGGKR
jgi:hypothetical protein